MSCNLEVNTSDPQASTDIEVAKKDHFFITEYNTSPVPNNLFCISEAWIESVWFFKIRKGKVVKEKSNGLQLDLKLTGFSSPQFADNKYILTWEMKDDQGNGIGKGNGVYILPLKSVSIPDTIHISIYKTKEDMSISKVTQFALFRKR
jgi:hypothetical protein